MNKKLQIFVSSTYTDLIEERQAAVQAILEAHHIPAGMELFAAGDQSQLEIIQRWIDESDVFMLILGGRYGSVDERSGKSYIQLEYEHAVAQGKPLFSLIMSETFMKRRVMEHGVDVLERERPQEYRAFRETVRRRMCGFCDDKKDIKLEIRKALDTLADSRGSSLRGWIPGPLHAQIDDTGAVHLADAFVRSGLRSAFRIKADNPLRDIRVKELIHEEARIEGGKYFRLAASSGANYLNPDGKVWAEAGLSDMVWNDGSPFVAVLESPFSSFAVTRALANHITRHHWEDKTSLDRLKELGARPNITIRVTEHAVNCSLFLTRSAVLYDPYLWAHPGAGKRTENNFWVFEFRKLDDANSASGCYTLLEKHFEFLLSTSVSLDEFLGKGDELFRQRTIEFSQNMASLLRSGANEQSSV